MSIGIVNTLIVGVVVYPAIAIGVFGLLVALGVVVYYAAEFFYEERYPDEVHFARTADGWRIATLRYRSEPSKSTEVGLESAAGVEPVVLIHGIGANHYNFDLTEDCSLARALSSAGFDVWVVELRGRGWSTRPRLFSRFRYDWSFDEYVSQDLPAAIGCVKQATGADRVRLVGFSLGGMAMYAYLADAARAAEVTTAVAIGAPVGFRFQARYLGGRVLRNLRWLRHQLWMRMLAPVAGYWNPKLVRLLQNPENIDGAVLRRALVNMACNFARNELLQFGDWLLNDTFRSLDHRRNYREELMRISVPMLSVAGARDLLAPPEAVKAAYDAVASADKRFVIAGRAHGFRANYGHEDLLLGRHARQEIYPLVVQWLRPVSVDEQDKGENHNGEAS
jgi:pimeloyl-ACP methyl ester carboxylesterase